MAAVCNVAADAGNHPSNGIGQGLATEPRSYVLYSGPVRRYSLASVARARSSTSCAGRLRRLPGAGSGGAAMLVTCVMTARNVLHLDTHRFRVQRPSQATVDRCARRFEGRI
jgi:hypothetical protein